MTLGWQHADFAAQVGEEVTLRAVDGVATDRDVRATLTACSEAVRSDDFVSYTVSFLAGPEAPREQAVFLVQIPGREPQPVFLVPVRELEDRLEYEAVFNQPVDRGVAREYPVHR